MTQALAEVGNSKPDNRSPVEEWHVAFARDVAEMARRHGVRDFSLEFYGNGPENARPWTRVKAYWHLGRLNEPGDITLRAEATHRTTERKPA